MPAQLSPFSHTYTASDIVYGQNCLDRLDAVLSSYNCDRVVVVTGKTVGSTDAVMQPVRAGLGDRLVAVFDETTPAKSAATARDGVDLMAEAEADALLAVGGGSSIDVARAMSVFDAEDRPAADLFSEVLPSGEIRMPDLSAAKTPVFAVPTTLSGAELTCAAGINLQTAREGERTDEVRSAPIFDPKITPKTLFYDPDLLATTPDNVVARSGMNGFNHGLESLYSRNANPMTDASARHGLELLREALPALGDGTEAATRGTAQIGIVLASQGLIDPESNANKYNLIHAFGHILSRFYEIQQGAVHGIVTPHVLRYVFDEADGRRRLLADALGVDTTAMDDDAVAAAVVEEVTAVRDGLGLPTSLQAVPGLEQDALPEVAAAITEDVGLLNRPVGLDPTVADFQGVLEAAWEAP
jgi:alcohol dehydrogenase